MNRTVLALGAAALASLGLVVLLQRRPEPPPRPREPAKRHMASRTASAAPSGASSDGQLVLPAARPEPDHPRRAQAAATEPSTRADEAPPASEDPLTGLDFVDATPSELAELKVPEGVAGVLVRGVDPASPAAEAALKRGDVIVRALREKITSTEVLRTTVGSREQTLLTVYRDGYPFQVVLHRPFHRGR